jgi:hypothetical protein
MIHYDPRVMTYVTYIIYFGMFQYTPVQHQHDPRLRNLHGRAKSLGEQKKAVILKWA